MWDIVRNRQWLTYKKTFPLSVKTFPNMANFQRAETKAVRIPADGVSLNADLTVPPGARVTIAFAHGSGSSRRSPRNRHVAETLNRYNFATLLADLLTEEEEIVDMRGPGTCVSTSPCWPTGWSISRHGCRTNLKQKALKIGWFGASTGAGAALIAAARRPENVIGVVSRGGRPDLAGDISPRLKRLCFSSWGKMILRCSSLTKPRSRGSMSSRSLK